jgi:hypothetical protein
MSSDHRDIGIVVKKYVGELIPDVAGRSSNCDLHGIFLLGLRCAGFVSGFKERQLLT